MRIEALSLENFPPFADGVLEFPFVGGDDEPGEIHLLTGENGTGKTRLLCLIAAALGNAVDLDSRAPKSSTSNVRVRARCKDGFMIWDRNSGKCSIGWKQQAAERFLAIPMEPISVGGNRQRDSLLDRRENEPARAALAFRGTVRTTDSKILAMQQVKIGKPADHLSFDPSKDEDTLVCQSMANLKMGAAMEHMHRGPGDHSRSTRIVERLESTLAEITGRTFSFDVVPHPDVRLRVFWGDVPMRLMQLPDGLRSIIGWLVSCIAKLESQFPDDPDPLDVPLVLLLDEPESHLHPAWQRKVLPAAQALLPHAQTFVATHSPFVISSVNRGWIHILRADDSGVVRADRPIACSEGDSYLDVVEDILGVTEWYDPETERLLAEFRAARDRVINHEGQFDELRDKAAVIARRSDSLRELMGREIEQARLITQALSRHAPAVC